MLTQAPPQTTVAEQLAVEIRRKVIEMSASPSGVHIGGSLSIADLLAVLYAEVLRDPAGQGGSDDRDHLILSKGQFSRQVLQSATSFLLALQLHLVVRPGLQVPRHHRD